jgi:DHA2 family multidrug resistance protein
MEQPTFEVGFRKWIIAVTVIICTLLELIDTTVVNVALSQLMGNLGATLSEVSWVVAAYGIANIIVVPMSGWFSIQFGRRNYFVGSVILFTVASFLCGNSTSIWELVFFRFVQGIGGGALMATSQSILYETFPPHQRALGQALFGMGIILGPTFGPTLGGYIIDNYDWPIIFFINIPIGIIATGMALTFIRDIKYDVVKQTLSQVDWLGIFLLILGIGCLQMVLEQGEREEWFESQMIVLGTIGAVVGVIGFIWRELTYEYPIVDLRILRNPNTAFGSFLTFIVGFGLFAMVFTIPVFTQGTLGYTALQTGMLFIPGALLTGFSMPIMGRLLSNGVPPKFLTLAGFIFTLIFLVWMMTLLTPGTSDGDMFYPLLFRGLGLGMSMIPLITYTMSGLSGAQIPQATGFTSMMRQLGGAFGVAVVSSFVTNRIQVHRADLLLNITSSNPLATERLNAMTRNFATRSASFDLAQTQAYKALEGVVMKQSSLLAFKDVFQFVAFFFLACIPLILFMRSRATATPVAMDAH